MKSTGSIKALHEHIYWFLQSNCHGVVQLHFPYHCCFLRYLLHPLNGSSQMSSSISNCPPGASFNKYNFFCFLFLTKKEKVFHKIKSHCDRRTTENRSRLPASDLTAAEERADKPFTVVGRGALRFRHQNKRFRRFLLCSG